MGYYYKNNIAWTPDWVLAKYNSDGTLDNSFGDNGLVFNVDNYNSYAMNMTIQPDNKILVAGFHIYEYIEIAPDVWAPVEKSFIKRFESNGAPDLTFGNNGLMIMDFNSMQSCLSSITLLEDNKILAGGYKGINNITILLKLNSDGSIDDSFGNSGLIAFDDPDFRFILWDFKLLKDGNILCYGSEFLGFYLGQQYCRGAILKLDANGELITSFGNNGIVIINEFSFGDPFFTQAVVLGNHQVLLGGYIEGRHFLLKLNPDGSLDSNFGDQGIVRHHYPFVDMAVWKNGQIYVAGCKLINPYDYGYSVCRFNANGTIDETFNDTGYFDINISPNNDYVQCITFQPDGKLILSGGSRTTGSTNFTMVRLITDLQNDCTAINNLNYYKCNDDCILLTWSAPENDVQIEGYRIFRNSHSLNEGLLTGTTYTDENLPIGNYEYYVITYYANGCISDCSNHVTATVGVGIAEIEKKGEIVIYPNPTTGKMRIESGELRIKNVEFYDAYGRKQNVRVENLHTLERGFDISHLSAGVYIVQISTEAGQVTKKVLKE
ncbi:MAG: T9SS type A sorting domain-containing protein [Lentimicrobiaceae bacterium]|nr:T9SS type A sorting domain-containing protein [Lentimicrobiaceae bacterium]